MATKRVPYVRIHPETGETLYRGERAISVEFKGMKRVVRMAGWFPEGGGDGIQWRDDGAAADRALAEMKAEYARGVRMLAQRVVAKISDIQPYGKNSKKSLSDLLTGSPNSFSKYVLGHAIPSHPTMILLKLLDKRPQLVKVIQTIKREMK
ncbi:MAG: type II toxin-antitoxin system MqsA family antitoxin [Alphaproteobacteria bacterium]|nr:type II toxin-antitoxin system MqsA family antitoxin [Alphaproteobacteria bacterium]